MNTLDFTMTSPTVNRINGTTIEIDDGWTGRRKYSFSNYSDATIAERVWTKESLTCNFTKFSVNSDAQRVR